MQYFKYFIYLSLSVSGFLSHAEFERTLVNPISYTVDIVPRNTNVGEDESARLHFEKWISMSDEAVLGLTEAGQVYGVVSLDKLNQETGQKVRKNYAYLLSGERKISEIFLDTNDTLWAVDQRGEVLVFDRSEWLKTPMKKTARRIGKGLVNDLAYLTTLYLVGKYMLLAEFMPDWDLGVMPTLIIGGMAGTALGISQFLRAANTYEVMNRNTDAFVSTHLFMNLGPDVANEFSDLVQNLQLKEGQQKNRELFDRTCELRLLPLPVDHSTWKP